MNYIPVGQRDDTYDLFALVKRIEVKTSSKVPSKLSKI